MRLTPGDFRTEFLEVRFFKSSLWCLVLVCYVLSFFQNYEFGYIVLAILDNDVEQDMDNGHPRAQSQPLMNLIHMLSFI